MRHKRMTHGVTRRTPVNLGRDHYPPELALHRCLVEMVATTNVLVVDKRA
jgi:hypothetical protein